MLTTLITGVSRQEGLGYETARQLGKKGFHVIITARETAKTKLLCTRLADEGISASGAELDVTNDDHVISLAGQVEKEFGKIDALINNAGNFYDAGADPLTIDFSYFDAAMDLNVKGAWPMMNRFVPLLRKSTVPRIVNVSSGAASHSDPVFGLSSSSTPTSAYAVSKLALNGC